MKLIKSRSQRVWHLMENQNSLQTLCKIQMMHYIEMPMDKISLVNVCKACQKFMVKKIADENGPPVVLDQDQQDTIVELPGWTMNHRPCGECVYFREMKHDISLCSKKLMAVLKNKPVLSPVKTPCFQGNSCLGGVGANNA